MALDSQIITEYTDFSNEVQRLMGSYYSEAKEDLNFYAGSMFTSQEEAKLRHQNRNGYQVNKIRRVINTYSGYERENRVSTVIGPVEDSDEKTAEQLSDVMLYIYEKGDAHIATSDCFDHCLKTGLGVLGIRMDYLKDGVNGDVKFWWKPYNSVLLDPYFTRRDLGDCDRAATRDILSKDHVKNLLPFVSEKEIDSLPTGVTDQKFFKFVLTSSNINPSSKHLVTYDQYWTRSSRKAKLLVDRDSGEQIDVSDFSEEDLSILQAQVPTAEVVKTSVPTVKLHIIVGGQLLYEGPDPTSLDVFPFVPMLCYFEPYIDRFDLRIQGIIRSQKDPQRLYNRRMNQVTDWLETKIHTGFKVMNGAVLDPSTLFETGQSRLIVVNKGFDPDRDVQQLNASDLPPNVLQYMSMLDNDILEVSGINETQLGVDEGGNTQVSGKLAQVRASQGMTGTRGVFDSYEYTLKILGKLVLETIQKNYSSEKVARIINDEPTEQFHNQMFQQYDTVIKQSVLTKTQRDAYYYELLRLRELGVAIPDSEVLDSVPIQGKSKIREILEKQEQAAQQQAQIEQEAQQRTNALVDAELAGKIAYKEAETARKSSQFALEVERFARAEGDVASAALNRAKAMTEIENLETDQLVKLVQVVKLLETPAIASSGITQTKT